MKISFKLLAVAAIASLTLVACGNNNTEATDSVIDSTAIEAVVEEEPIEVLDTTPVVEEQQAPVQAPAKKATKKTVNKKEVVKEATNEATTIEKKVETTVSDQQKHQDRKSKLMKR